ncbi:hypothetical protein WN48_05940 [Eufriesea mexicana]|nr:hypothetical protein WN48_05940 [Eufriesea mexicana]
MRVPGCGVPPPPDCRRFSNNSQTSNNTNCNCDNNVNTIGSSLSAERNDIEYYTGISASARDQRRQTPGGCLEHHGAGCLTAETARPTRHPPQKPRERPFCEFLDTWTSSGSGLNPPEECPSFVDPCGPVQLEHGSNYRVVEAA